MSRHWTDVDPSVEQEYLKSGGGECPFCHSENIQGGLYDPEMSGLVVECLECGNEWMEQFTLTGILVEKGSWLDTKRE